MAKINKSNTMKKKLFTFIISFSLLTIVAKANGPTGQVLNFIGAADYCTTTAFSTDTDNFTLQARVLCNGGSGTNQFVVLNGNGGTSGYAIYMDTNDSLFILLGGVAFIDMHTTLKSNIWQTITIERSKGNWMAWIDSTALGFTSNVSPNPISLGVDSFNIGGDQAGGSNFNGLIDQVNFWGRALSDSELMAEQVCEVSRGDSNLIATYYFNEGIADANNSNVTTLADSSGNGHNLTLMNFTLNGGQSNWIDTTGALTGQCGKNVAGISEINPQSDAISSYPNPTSSITNLVFTSSAERTITVYTLIGEKVMQTKSNTNKILIDLSSESNGMYLVEVQDNLSTSMVKVVKQ